MIIEERSNDGSHYTKDEHGRFTGSTSSSGGSGSSGGIGKTKYKPMERANKGGITINPKTFVKVRSAFMNKYQNAPKGLSGTVKHGNYYYYCTSDGLGSIIINSKYKG